MLPSPLERNLRRVCKLNTNIGTKREKKQPVLEAFHRCVSLFSFPIPQLSRDWTHTHIRLTCSHVFIQAKRDSFGGGRLQFVQLQSKIKTWNKNKISEAMLWVLSPAPHRCTAAISSFIWFRTAPILWHWLLLRQHCFPSQKQTYSICAEITYSP